MPSNNCLVSLLVDSHHTSTRSATHNPCRDRFSDVADLSCPTTTQGIAATPLASQTHTGATMEHFLAVLDNASVRRFACCVLILFVKCLTTVNSGQPHLTPLKPDGVSSPRSLADTLSSRNPGVIGWYLATMSGRRHNHEIATMTVTVHQTEHRY